MIQPRVKDFILTTSETAAKVKYKKNWLRFTTSKSILPGYTWLFTDGSTTGWHAAVLVLPGLSVRKLAAHAAPTKSANVGAEMNGLILGLKHAQPGLPVWVVHDYVGVGAWVTGGWEVKTFEAQEQVREIEKIIDERNLTLHFTHHGGHQKDACDFTKFNNMADRLCSGKTVVDLYETWNKESHETGTDTAPSGQRRPRKRKEASP